MQNDNVAPDAPITVAKILITNRLGKVWNKGSHVYVYECERAISWT